MYSPPTASHRFPALIAILIVIVAVWSGIQPADRAVWWAEVIPVFAVFAALIFTYPRFRFSNLAYFLMSLWLFMHLIGAHYTFADVPFAWGNRLLTPILGGLDRLQRRELGTERDQRLIEGALQSAKHWLLL